MVAKKNEIVPLTTSASFERNTANQRYQNQVKTKKKIANYNATIAVIHSPREFCEPQDTETIKLIE